MEEPYESARVRFKGKESDERLLTTTRSRPIPPPCTRQKQTEDSERRRNKNTRQKRFGTGNVHRAAGSRA